MKLPRLAQVLCCLALAACSSSSKPTDGGTTGGSGTSSSSSSGGSSSSSGTVTMLPDAGPPDATQICLALWAGQQRVEQLEAMPLFMTLGGTQGTYCPAPTAAQRAQLTQQTNALAAAFLTLVPPDGGWPDGSGPSICDDPSTALDGLPAQISDSITAGRATWNAAANAQCAQGLMLSSDLLAYVYSDGGEFAGEAQTFGSLDGGEGPCTQILQGQLHDGGACVYPFDCAAGLYCQSTGANGVCSGTCAPLVAAGAACGPLDVCVGTLSCLSGFCGGPDAGPGPKPTGGAGATCTVDGDCQPCLICQALGIGSSTCATYGLAGDACTTDFDCGTPWLYCDTTTKVCAASATFGQPCTATTSSYACLDGWCDGTTCQPISGVGGACSGSVPSCLPGLYCKEPQAGSNGTCAPLPTLGETCGLTQGLSDDCAGGDVYCDTVTGSCAALPGAGVTCAPGAECASGNYCQITTVEVCVPLQAAGASCASIPCQAGLTCSIAGLCVAPLAGGAACQAGVQCLSGNCVAGTCSTPCSTAPFGGCENQGVSFILGLGGALAWFDRRRRKAPFQPTR